MASRTGSAVGRAHRAISWSQLSALSVPEWWILAGLAALGFVVNPLLDLTQPVPDVVGSVTDAAFAAALVVTARVPPAGLVFYGTALAGSFPLHEPDVVLTSIAFAACVVVRVGSIRIIAVFFALLVGGMVIAASAGQTKHGLGALIGIPFIALVSGAIGAILRFAFGRALTLSAELRRRMRTEQEIRAEERQLITDELHDDIAHDLTVISTYIGVLERENEEGDDTAARTLAISVLGSTTRKVLDDLRLMMQHGTAVDDRSVRALTAAFDDARRELSGASLHVEVDGDPEAEQLNRLVATTLSRTLRECVTNILKHHGRSPVRIRLAVLDDVVRLDVTNVLPTVPNPAPPGFGVIRISERVESLGGTCAIGPDGDEWVVSAQIPRHALL